MRTRIIALVVALLLAVVGGVLLVGYVRGADQRAADGAELTSVLVVTGEIPAGTSADRLALLVEESSIPSSFLAEDAITGLTGLDDLAGLVTTTALVPGEQVVRARFATPESFVGGGGSVQVPAGLQEVSVSLDPSRVLGGLLSPGDTIGVFVSVDDPGGDIPRQTRLMLDGVLVTAVSGGAAADGATVAVGTVTVTVAVTEQQAQSIIYSQEFARLWLSRQNEQNVPGTGAPFTIEELVE